MNKLAIAFRAAQLYTHSAHLLASGPTSHQDHLLFGDFYGAYEKAFDTVLERAIGLGEDVDLQGITLAAGRLAAEHSFNKFSNESGFETVESFEQQIRKEIASLVPDYDDGAQNLLQGLADESLGRSYHIKQRLA